MSRPSRTQREFIALVADVSIAVALVEIIRRPQSLGIRTVEFNRSDIPVHPGRDPGCRLKSDQFLRDFQRQYAHALVVFDRIGCGAESESAVDLERHVEVSLARSGWAGRCAAVVIDPELETWVWGDSPHIEMCLGWRDRQSSLRAWLEQEGIWPSAERKPPDPKQAFLRALREVRTPASSSIFADLAARVSLDRCADTAFCRLRSILQRWFPLRAP